MLTVETIRKVRLALAKGESQRSVAKKYLMSRNTVKKLAEGEQTKFQYAKREVKYPRTWSSRRADPRKFWIRKRSCRRKRAVLAKRFMKHYSKKDTAEATTPYAGI
jgi:hypothetical protein